jgi:hypothetical protein
VSPFSPLSPFSPFEARSDQFEFVPGSSPVGQNVFGGHFAGTATVAIQLDPP